MSYSQAILINSYYKPRLQKAEGTETLISANRWCLQGGVVAGQGSAHSSMTAPMVPKETSCAPSTFKSYC